MDPFKESQYAFDREILANMFPIQLWKKLLGCVNNTNVLTNIFNSSLVFREMLVIKRAEFMFPKVWKRLEEHIGYQEYLEEEDEIQLDASRCTDKGIRIHSLGKKPYSWMLACRMVCRTWGETIDSYYSSNCVSNQNCSRIWAQYFTKSQDAHNFLKHFKGTHQDQCKTRNPFVGRSIELALGAMSLNMLDDVTKMLTKYGSHVWDCSLTDIAGAKLTSGFVAQMQSWLALMPNLKTLSLYFTHQQQFDNATIRCISENTPGICVKSLINLELVGVPAALINHVIDKNNQLENLLLHGMETLENIDPQKVNLLTNLQEFSLAISSSKDIEVLKDLLVRQPSLLSVDLRFYEEFVSWEKIFSIVERNWEGSLRKLFIQLPPTRSDSDEIELLLSAGALQLKLIKLEKLTLAMSNIVPFDFLLPMKDCLEYLEIEICYNAKCMRDIDLAKVVVRDDKLRILGYKYRLHESNIWSLFPKLKEIVYSGYFYISFEFGEEREQIDDWMLNDEEYRVVCNRIKWKQSQGL